MSFWRGDVGERNRRLFGCKQLTERLQWTLDSPYPQTRGMESLGSRMISGCLFWLQQKAGAKCANRAGFLFVAGGGGSKSPFHGVTMRDTTRTHTHTKNKKKYTVTTTWLWLKNRCQNGTLVSGNMDQNLRFATAVEILSHIHMQKVSRGQNWCPKWNVDHPRCFKAGSLGYLQSQGVPAAHRVGSRLNSLSSWTLGIFWKAPHVDPTAR